MRVKTCLWFRPLVETLTSILWPRPDLACLTTASTTAGPIEELHTCTRVFDLHLWQQIP